MLELLPAGLRPYAKFIYPAFAAVVATLILWATEGALNKPQLEVGLLGLLAATLAFVSTNASEGVRRVMKAIVPAVLTIAVVGIHYLVAGEFDNEAWRLAIAGFGAALITLVVPNGA